jgi:hypothetical protein
VIGSKHKESTYRMANLRGRVAKTGKRKKQMTKHAAAARLHPPKTSRRSHLLTRARGQLRSENGVYRKDAVVDAADFERLNRKLTSGRVEDE